MMTLESLQIGPDRKIGENEPTFIIAEIGQNHQGDIEIAKELIKIAKECGADCVKFQKTCLTEKFNKAALNRPYIGENSWGPTYGEHKKYLEFSNEQYRQLQAFANEIGILFTASAMDLESLNFLATLQVPFIKIGSGDSNNLTMIKEAASKNIPLIISTGEYYSGADVLIPTPNLGMQNLDGVKNIYKTVSSSHKKFVLLHCVSSYPTLLEDVNLKAISLFKNEFPDIFIGYSGHELGIDVTCAAVALGAKVIERHLTLDKEQKGSDHCCSLEPQEFKMLVDKIRNLEIALGEPVKLFQKSERVCFEKLGKTVVATKPLEKGQILKLEDLKVKVAEPKGVDGSLIYNLVGQKLIKDVDEDESITKDCLE